MAKREGEASDEYSEMMLLEDLESLREQMDEVGVNSLEEAQRWLDQPVGDREIGVPSAADRAGLESLVRLMDELEVTTREQLDGRIREMHSNMSWE